jgi:FecR protein
MPRARATTFAVMLAFCLFALPAAAATPEIGGAVAVKNDVTAADGDVKRKLEKGGKVFQNETLATSKTASAEIEFLDKTKLAVGPSAQIVLDKFLYDASATPGSISINLTKGAFRFITGDSPKSTYEIKTPTASMGVRGTVFDVYVADDGETVVLLHEGGVDVCSTPTTCQRHDKVGHIVHIGLDRVISSPLRWDGSLMKGLAVGTAFPFVGKKLLIDPVRRLTQATLLNGGAPRALQAPGKALRNLGRGLRSPF